LTKLILTGLGLIVITLACSAPAASGTSVPVDQLTPAATLPATAGTSATAFTTAPAAATSGYFTRSGIGLTAPTCDGSFTPEQTEGPFYKGGSPEANILYQSGMTGTRLIVVGYVLDADCQPIPGAWLDFWQADASGTYDNQGYALRGHQYTDEQGRYYLETVMPGEYPGRTQHIHVKVQAPGGQVLTTQLYFPGSAGNSSDSIYDPATQVTIEDHGDYQLAVYNFVINAR
jgi:protocatechuate 3,4-dioxygenase beta subunit